MASRTTAASSEPSHEGSSRNPIIAAPARTRTITRSTWRGKRSDCIGVRMSTVCSCVRPTQVSGDASGRCSKIDRARATNTRRASSRAPVRCSSVRRNRESFGAIAGQRSPQAEGPAQRRSVADRNIASATTLESMSAARSLAMRSKSDRASAPSPSSSPAGQHRYPKRTAGAAPSGIPFAYCSTGDVTRGSAECPVVITRSPSTSICRAASDAERGRMW